MNPDIDHGKPQRRRLFLEKLAMDMIAPAIEKRQTIPAQLNQAPNPPSLQGLATEGGARKRARCSSCPRSTDKKTAERCSSCGKPICKENLRIVCNPDCHH